MKKILLTLLVVLLCPLLSPGWGGFGHKVITQLAVYSLPGGMQGFYFRNLNQLVQLSNAADQRAETDSMEASRHFIYMDHYGENPFGAVPKQWEKATAKYKADTLRKYGTLPWVIDEVREKLTQAFRAGDTAQIVSLSADLSHYVADAYSPLRTTVNHNGQLSNQEGLQPLWENKLPERHIGDYKLHNKPAKYTKTPLNDTWQAIQDSYGFLGATFDLEEKVTRGFTPEQKYIFSHRFGQTRRAYSDAFADAYHKEQIGGMVMFRMQLASSFVGSMWLTAWKDAGSPNLEKLLKKPIRKEESEKLDEQLSAWKDNQLVPQNMLLAQLKEKAVEAPDQIRPAADMAPPPPVAPAPAPAAASNAGPAAPAAAEAEKVKTKAKTEDGTVKQKVKDKKPEKKAPKKVDDGW
ncbi:hypothetical protein FY528_05660 [Hymenobacter lutimineralis]|uniref:S1/P1 Nuclease n=1 Tax=Hymenobacter lutimineralis TaxID=2606448 RepID=A0A5D6VB93_9BACT|nr:zinc dependent phospholipase C family protein [Hymenobacter lutimineralis]TYZ11844.1 hypothetical protein FY528_05660 [Hymenobacter lutimineralis]